MTKANDLASLLDANGDVVSSALDNVPANPTLTSLGIPNHDDITVDVSGNASIGTSSPVANTPLTLQGQSGYTDNLWLKSVGTDIDSRINIAPTGTGLAQVNNTNGTPIAFQISGSEKMRITSAGDVGIQTSSPVTALDVRGEISVAYDATYGLRFYNEDRNNWSSIGNTTATGDSTANLVFKTSGGEAMRLDSSGNVTIQPAGTTIRSFGETVALKKDQSAPTRLSVRNDTNDSNSAAGVTVSSYGNSWAIECGSQVKNSNALTFALDAALATPSIKMKIDSSGRVTMPYQPAFSAYFNGNNNNAYTLGAGGGQINFNATYYNQGGHYSTSTGRFTAPVSGAYQFNACLFGYNGGQISSQASTGVIIYKNGIQYHYIAYNYLDGASSYPSLSGSVILYCNANDYVTLSTTTGVYTDGNNVYTHWSGHLIG